MSRHRRQHGVAAWSGTAGHLHVLRIATRSRLRCVWYISIFDVRLVLPAVACRSTLVQTRFVSRPQARLPTFGCARSDVSD